MGKKNDVLDIRSVLQEPDLHVWEYDGSNECLVVCISGIGGNATAVQGYDFARTATCNGNNSVLYFADPHRSWLSHPGLIEKMVARIETKAKEIGATRIMTLGHSMGAFTAAILPAFTKIDCAVCFSPQVSVHPDVVPDEDRWMEHRHKIKEHRIRSINDHIVENTQYYVYFGRHPREAPQRDRFVLADNTKFFVIPNVKHSTPQLMRKIGILDDVIRFSFEGRNTMLRRILRTNLDAHQITQPTKDMLMRAAELNITKLAE